MVLLFEMVTMMFQRNPERERERDREGKREMFDSDDKKMGIN